MNMNLPHGDFVVFVDESGDHSMTSIDAEYPLFVLSLCVFAKAHYAQAVTPAVRLLKFETFGHDMVILHEHDIRKRSGPFAPLGKEAREAFMERLTGVMAAAEFSLIAVVINKDAHARRYAQPAHPYHLAMAFALERLYRFMEMHGQADRLIHVVCEARGKKEDQELELEFRRICDGNNAMRLRLPFEILIADKKSNSEGLQLADLTSRPIGLSILRPEQQNRAMAVLEGKFYRNGAGRKEGYGLKCFP